MQQVQAAQALLREKLNLHSISRHLVTKQHCDADSKMLFRGHKNRQQAFSTDFQHSSQFVWKAQFNRLESPETANLACRLATCK